MGESRHLGLQHGVGSMAISRNGLGRSSTSLIIGYYRVTTTMTCLRLVEDVRDSVGNGVGGGVDGPFRATPFLRDQDVEEHGFLNSCSMRRALVVPSVFKLG